MLLLVKQYSNSHGWIEPEQGLLLGILGITEKDPESSKPVAAIVVSYRSCSTNRIRLLLYTYPAGSTGLPRRSLMRSRLHPLMHLLELNCNLQCFLIA
jgi:hypothetical protein